MGQPKLPIGDARYVVCDYQAITPAPPKPPFPWGLAIVGTLLITVISATQLELGVVYRDQCFGACSEFWEARR
jgi:hypothetical protein